ncbi:hypothetical protein ABENE_05855 [Asticcacaulis benevestitus DSM 16100 = ATCC BAA-896]|uniref:Uncharacterized protein n=1 Tax=Asticcacaulis benevestitus DSM 16100 = ATCC BAA-896 TaxID=1121022 RepID=V4PYF4_9CAUL|nr:hypothetical protein ABENE_05855 [Asticcacaulis benevestitus DSM 16100 = ATCC BAA-896]
MGGVRGVQADMCAAKCVLLAQIMDVIQRTRLAPNQNNLTIIPPQEIVT